MKIKQLVIFTILSYIFENIYTIYKTKLDYLINYYNSNNSNNKNNTNTNTNTNNSDY